MTNTLDHRDTAILERLSRGDATAESLADVAAEDPDSVSDRLDALADDGLVRAVDDGYALTENGERLLSSTPAGTADDRIDTPDDVEAAIRALELRPDREAAVRGAFSFLRYWGVADGSEIVDAVYSEDPAGYDSAETWWTDLVRDRLASLPSVDPPDGGDGPWRFEGTATVERETRDGRDLLDEAAVSKSSVTYALARADLDADQRSAALAAFRLLAEKGEATAERIRAETYPGREAGYETADEWWRDCVRDALESLPGVERSSDDGDVWRYGPGSDDSAPTETEADASAEPSEPSERDRG